MRLPVCLCSQSPGEVRLATSLLSDPLGQSGDKIKGNTTKLLLKEGMKINNMSNPVSFYYHKIFIIAHCVILQQFEKVSTQQKVLLCVRNQFIFGRQHLLCNLLCLEVTNQMFDLFHDIIFSASCSL